MPVHRSPAHLVEQMAAMVDLVAAELGPAPPVPRPGRQ
jgi:hypothetical protein